MANTIHSAILLLACRFISSEWIEITQRHRDHAANNTTTIILKRTAIASVLHQAEVEITTTPSPEWIEYQRERFRMSDKQDAHKQTLIVSSEQHLKNSAKIVVPAQTTSRNQYLQTKTRMDVKRHEAASAASSRHEIEHVKQATGATTARGDRYYGNNADDGDSEEFPNAQQAAANFENVPLAENDDNEESVETIMEQPTLVEEETEEAATQLEFPTVQGFFKFLKSMQKSFLKKSKHSIEQKINMLKQLRDNLMQTIERKFSTLWLTPTERQRRRKRGILDESSLNFPPEAALMSINFLTFAVFLIKLVLQVVHIIKSKHYSFSGMINTDANAKNTFRH